MKKKTTFSIILITLVAVTSIFVGRTYARYASSANVNGTVQVAKWAMKVNSQDITADGATDAGSITLTPVANAHIASGKIAPDGEVAGVFTIDPTDTEVSIEYIIDLNEITASEGGVVPTGLTYELKVCEGQLGEHCDVSTSAVWNTLSAELEGVNTGNYVGTSLLVEGSKLNKQINVLVTASWPNNEMNNVNDTAAGVAAATLTLPFDVTVKQYIPVVLEP